MNDEPALPLPTPLLRFVALFNGGQCWESHEVLEGPWRAEGSEFYHGLILYASAFVHLQRGNAHGIVAQLEKARKALAQYEPEYLGVDVTLLRQDAIRLMAEVRRHRSEPPSLWTDRIDQPKLQLDTRRIRGTEPELGEVGSEYGDRP